MKGGEGDTQVGSSRVPHGGTQPINKDEVVDREELEGYNGVDDNTVSDGLDGNSWWLGFMVVALLGGRVPLSTQI